MLKPSELTPASTALLGDAVAACELPSGVVNLVNGVGAEAGEALVRHPGIDMVTFTGSRAIGGHVAALAAGAIKRTHLELGGKSASILFADAPLDQAVAMAVRQPFLNAGQGCVAWSRLLVERSAHDAVVERAVAIARSLVIGPPGDAGTTLGPVVSARQRDRIRGHIDGAVAAGARLVTGGAAAPPGLDRGWFVQPTIFADVDPSLAIAREEVFGPVLAIIPFDSEEDAVRLSEDSRYGLHGAVFSGDAERALRVARRLRTGQVLVNGAKFEPLLPFGGFRESGFGRQSGRYGLEAYLEPKGLHL